MAQYEVNGSLKVKGTAENAARQWTSELSRWNCLLCWEVFQVIFDGERVLLDRKTSKVKIPPS